VMDSNDEFLVLDIHFVSSNGGMTRAFELLHEVLVKPRWVVCMCGVGGGQGVSRACVLHGAGVQGGWTSTVGAAIALAATMCVLCPMQCCATVCLDTVSPCCPFRWEEGSVDSSKMVCISTGHSLPQLASLTCLGVLPAQVGGGCV
jgi:hypothetical protein